MFFKNSKYTRTEVRAVLGLPEAKGGAWATGHVRHAGQHFIFCGIDTPGRTGQNYANRFDSADLIWHPRGDANPAAPVFAELISGTALVHVFYRSGDRDPFTYAGTGKPVASLGGTIEVRWSFESTPEALAEELPIYGDVIEGAKKQITVNAYERDPTAKLRCVKRWGAACVVCDFDFGAVYGRLGDGFIHVHHLKPMHCIGKEYLLNPEEDLRPVCPNCHAMLHRQKVVLSIDELRMQLRQRFDKSFTRTLIV